MTPTSLAPEPECLLLHCTLETVKNENDPPCDVLPCMLSFNPNLTSEELGLKNVKKLAQLINTRTQIQVCRAPEAAFITKIRSVSKEQEGSRLQYAGPSVQC